MRMVQDPRHPTRATHSISVGGKNYDISETGVIENVPDHLGAELKGHGFVPEGEYQMYMALEAEKNRDRDAEQARLDKLKDEDEERRLQGIADEERLRVRTRFDEERKIRNEQAEHNERVEAARNSDGVEVVNRPPNTETPNQKIGPTGDEYPEGGVHTVPRRSVTMTPRRGGETGTGPTTGTNAQ